MGPLVINLENLSKRSPKTPGILQNLDFRFVLLTIMSWRLEVEIRSGSAGDDGKVFKNVYIFCTCSGWRKVICYNVYGAYWMTQCNRCHLQYIAETKRCLKGRFNELRFSVHKANIKVTLYLQWCLAHKRCSAPAA